MEVDKWEVGTRCLAFHGPMLYEAKVIKVYDPDTDKVSIRLSVAEGRTVVENDPEEHFVSEAVRAGDTMAYFVHYKGWKQTWDEWVGQDRILAYTPDNLQVQRELKQAAAESQKQANARSKEAAAKRRSTGEPSVTAPAKDDRAAKRSRTSTARAGRSTTGDGRGSPAASSRTESAAQSHPHGDDVEAKDAHASRSEVKMAVPNSLKSLLVDDWEYVTKNLQLVPLPRDPTVEDILKNYIRDALKEEADAEDASAEKETFHEVFSGLKLYFDRSLGSLLLYRHERQQYFEIRNGNANFVPSQVYGAEHLLRLFVSLPGLLAQTSMDPQSLVVLRQHLEEFLKWLANHKDYFAPQYEETSGRYEALSKGV